MYYACGVKTLGQNIKLIRESRGMSQPELSEACGWEFKQARISHYETSARSPKVEDLMTIAKVLNCSIIEFFDDVEGAKSDDRRKVAAESAASLSPARQKLIRQLIAELQD